MNRNTEAVSVWTFNDEKYSMRSSKDKDINEDLKLLMQILQYSKLKIFQFQVDVKIEKKSSHFWTYFKFYPSFKSLLSLVPNLSLPKFMDIMLNPCRFRLPFK